MTRSIHLFFYGVFLGSFILGFPFKILVILFSICFIYAVFSRIELLRPSAQDLFLTSLLLSIALVSSVLLILSSSADLAYQFGSPFLTISIQCLLSAGLLIFSSLLIPIGASPQSIYLGLSFPLATNILFSLLSFLLPDSVGQIQLGLNSGRLLDIQLDPSITIYLSNIVLLTILRFPGLSEFSGDGLSTLYAVLSILSILSLHIRPFYKYIIFYLLCIFSLLTGITGPAISIIFSLFQISIAYSLRHLLALALSLSVLLMSAGLYIFLQPSLQDNIFYIQAIVDKLFSSGEANFFSAYMDHLFSSDVLSDLLPRVFTGSLDGLMTNPLTLNNNVNSDVGLYRVIYAAGLPGLLLSLAPPTAALVAYRKPRHQSVLFLLILLLPSSIKGVSYLTTNFLFCWILIMRNSLSFSTSSSHANT